MNQRSIRLNKIVCREFNMLLRTEYRERASNITITDVSVSPDMRDAYVYFSVIGDDCAKKAAEKFLKKHAGLMRYKIFQRVQIKFSPKLNFRHDDSVERGYRTLEILDDLEK